MISQNNQIKKITKALTLTFLFTCVAQAEPPQNKKDLTHEFTVGLESLRYHYGESIPNTLNLMQLNGTHFGISAAYQMTYKDVFVRPELRWVYGHTDYTNGRKGSESERDKIPSMIIEPRLLVGIPLKATSNMTIAPYSGIGWRYKRDDCVDDINKFSGWSGWNRINKSWYIPLGARLQYDLNDRWDLRVFLEYDWFIRGRQSTYHREQIFPNYRMEYIPATIVYKQKEGWGAKAEMLVGYRFDKVAVAFGPFINFWHIQKSSFAPITTRVKFSRALGGRSHDGHDPNSYEPNNTTKEIGLKVNFYF